MNKIPTKSSQPSKWNALCPRRQAVLHSTDGAALVVSLALLVLLLALAMAIFLGAAGEVRNSSLYKHSQGLQELTESAVNLVQAQIKDATLENASLAPAQRHTWASQPGMIRTYGAGTNAVRSYKLYSWVNPRETGDASDSVPVDWSSLPAMYVDLNEPARDPAAPTDTNAMRYPIAYPPLPSTDPTAPAGYSVDSSAPLAPVAGFTNPVPMPVQWLYQLQDGSMVYPSSSTGSTAVIAGASASNPIVGRVAYWTDDETSKVNLNTAAGGEYWAKPVQKTELQYENSLWQPTRWEFQRYPGHPARTDLTKVFPPGLFGFATDAAGMLKTRRAIWQLIPRISDNGATRQTTRKSTPAPVAYDMDRLFTSPGEARFAANSTATGERIDFVADASWREQVERSKFLLTAASRAPETTAFGTPRVSIWPISSTDTPQRRTALDQLIAFASTIRKTGDPDDPKVPTVPVGYFFLRSSLAAADADVSANASILSYLAQMTEVPQPGLSSQSLASKYTGEGRDQILTQIYDYIRIVNKIDLQLSPNIALARQNSFAFRQTVPPAKRTIGGNDTYGFGRFPTVNQITLHFICTADAAVPGSNVVNNLSLRDENGTFSSLAPGERNVMALAYLEVAMPTVGYPNADYDNLEFTITGLDQIQLDGKPMGFPSSATMKVVEGDLAQKGNINTGYGGGIVKYLIFLSGRNITRSLAARNGFVEPPTRPSNLSLATFPYLLASQSVRVTGNTMNVSAANLRIQIVRTAGGTAHTVSVPWAAVSNIPVPTLPSNPNRWVFDQVGWDGTGTKTASPDGSRGRLPASNPPGWEASRLFLPANDTVVSTATVHGDYRITMVRPEEPANWAAVPFSTTSPRFAHRLHNTSGGGSFIPGSNISTGVLGLLNEDTGLNLLRPPVPPQADLNSLGLAHPLTFGDFDNGLPIMADGAYINAPDEVGGTDIGLFWDNTLAADFSQMNRASDFHSPNRKIASAVAFGSLPNAALQNRPWQTLLFRPAPEVTNHPGLAGRAIDGTSNSGAPADHQWLDLFWMPIVEPYAISENFSTAGKVNMNHRIAPFSYIDRTTALHAVLGSTGVIGVPSTVAGYPAATGVTAGRFRKSMGNVFYDNYLPFESQFGVNISETLIGVDNRLDTNRLFRAASEVCELPIVPLAPNASYTTLTQTGSGNWWNNYRYTGDNTREATYNDVYPRLTTRSNTFSVHYRVQLLKKVPGTDPGTWDESRDRVVSQARGSTVIERYLDPNAIYPNYATGFNSAASLETFYRFRVLQRSEFAP